MEALVPAFIAVFLAEFGGASQRTATAMLENGKSLIVPVLMLVALLAAAAVGGVLVAPVMPIVARGLLVGLSLLFAGLPMIFSDIKKPMPPGLGRFAMALLGAGGPFIVFALAARTGMPVLAAVGGLAGGLASMVPQLLTEKPLRRVIPLRQIRAVSAGLLSLAGLWIALSSLGLI